MRYIPKTTVSDQINIKKMEESRIHKNHKSPRRFNDNILFLLIIPLESLFLLRFCIN